MFHVKRLIHKKTFQTTLMEAKTTSLDLHILLSTDVSDIPIRNVNVYKQIEKLGTCYIV